MVPTARRFRRLAAACALAALTLACATAALAGAGNWAAPQIRAVTKEGVLGSSPANFAPQAPLTQAALADAIRATDDLQHSAGAGRADPAGAEAGARFLDRLERDDRRTRPVAGRRAGPGRRPRRLRARRQDTQDGSVRSL